MYYILKVLLVLSVVLPVLSAITLGLRFYARKSRKLQWLWDDWLTLLVWVLTAVTCALNFYAVLELGLGNPPPTLTLDQIVGCYKFLYSVILINYFTYGILKISVILFYQRIFSRDKGLIFWGHILIATIAAWTIAGVFAQAFATTPVKDFFIGKTTIKWGIFNVVMAVLDLFFDVLVLLLPVIAVKDLQISKKQKFGIIGLFWLGFICIISSAMRIYYDWEWNLLGPQSNMDWFQYIVSNTNLWLVIEGNVSIIAACMPTLGGLIRIKAPNLVSRFSHKATTISTNSHSHIKDETEQPLTKSASGGWVVLNEVSPRDCQKLSAQNGESRPVDESIQVETTFGRERVDV